MAPSTYQYVTALLIILSLTNSLTPPASPLRSPVPSSGKHLAVREQNRLTLNPHNYANTAATSNQMIGATLLPPPSSPPDVLFTSPSCQDWADLTWRVSMSARESLVSSKMFVPALSGPPALQSPTLLSLSFLSIFLQITHFLSRLKAAPGG